MRRCIAEKLPYTVSGCTKILNYKLVTSGKCDDASNGLMYVGSITECTAAAAELSLPDTSVSETNEWLYPKGCSSSKWSNVYFKSSSWASKCSSSYQCVCKRPPCLTCSCVRSTTTEGYDFSSIDENLSADGYNVSRTHLLICFITNTHILI